MTSASPPPSSFVPLEPADPMDGYPLERIRSEFPALQERADAPAPAFFDGPGGTQVPQPVIDAVSGYLATANANTGGPFPTSRASDATIAAARDRLATFLGAASPAEVVFGANMTTLTFAVSRALGGEWRAGDELVVTELDHQANIEPWRRVAADLGLEVRTLRLDRGTLSLDVERLESLLSSRTRLVAIGAASNAVGTITDVARAAVLARQAGALSYVDAVHLAPHRAIDVDRLGCDFLVCSAYKFFGPHVGVLWGRRELLERFRPYKVPPAPDRTPFRWETGTLNHEGIAGAAAAVDWIAGIGVPAGEPAQPAGRDGLLRAWQRIAAHEGRLADQLLGGLQEIDGVRVHGPPPGTPRTPTVAFTVDGHDPDRVAAALAGAGVYVWSGDFYAPNVIERLGLAASGGVVRAGLAAYSAETDVRRLLDAVARLASG